MAFEASNGSYIEPTGAGERHHPPTEYVLATSTFEEGLIEGRFCRQDPSDADGILNLDGTANPVLAGVALRRIGNAIESAGALSPLINQADFGRAGAFSVEVADGDSPARFDAVYVINGGAESGRATTVDTNVEAPGWEFIEEVKAGVWVVRGK